MAGKGDATAAQRKHVVATVGKGKVTYGDVLDALGSMGGKMQAMRTEAMLDATAAQLADRMVVEQAALRDGYDKKPAVKMAFEAVRRDLLAEAYWDDVAARTPAPTPAEVEARYRERIRDYEVPASRKCSRIVVATEEEARVARARVAGGAPFDAVAREVSIDPETRDRGGDLGSVTEEKLQHMDSALAKAIRQLPAGAVSEPQQSTAGWDLFTCQPLPARVLPLSEVQDRIAASIRKERISATVNGRVAQLESAAEAKATKTKASP
jgi:peptidyl-prolyl cis-trans isomerase C